MPEISNEQLSQVIERAMRDVTQEVKVQERAFGVADLRTHATEFAKVADVAWKITYDTKSASIEMPGGLAAWKITYDTKSAGIDQGPGQRQS